MIIIIIPCNILKASDSKSFSLNKLSQIGVNKDDHKRVFVYICNTCDFAYDTHPVPFLACDRSFHRPEYTHI